MTSPSRWRARPGPRFDPVEGVVLFDGERRLAAFSFD
jgi:hypothetical protein